MSKITMSNPNDTTNTNYITVVETRSTWDYQMSLDHLVLYVLEKLYPHVNKGMRIKLSTLIQLDVTSPYYEAVENTEYEMDDEDSWVVIGNNKPEISPQLAVEIATRLLWVVETRTYNESLLLLGAKLEEVKQLLSR